MSVSIQGVDKCKLLKALWENAKPASFFNVNSVPALQWDQANAEKEVKSYIDYYCGRCIKCDLSGDNADPWGYDRDWGQGAFEAVVKSIVK